MEIQEIKLTDIQPTQFYISEEKLRTIRAWFDPAELTAFEPVPIKMLHGRIIFTDGHTRAWAAYAAGLERIPLVWDTDELDWEAYQRCVDACLERNVRSVADFAGRILPEEAYRKEWDGWCDRMHEDLERARNAMY